jgi:hypothetical protein
VSEASSDVQKVAAGTSTISHLGSNLSTAQGVAVDGAGNIFVAARGGSGEVTKITADGTTTRVGSRLAGVTGVAVDSSGAVYAVTQGYQPLVVYR